MRRDRAQDPLRVAIVNDYEVVVRGVWAMLKDLSDRVDIVELDSDMPVSQPVDLALYDAFSMAGTQTRDIDEIIAHANVPRLVLYTWNITRDVVDAARSRGLAGVLSKTLTAAEIVAALERVHAGSFVVEPGVLPAAAVAVLEYAAGDWPGKEAGLTAREAEVVALITQGFSNQEIADRIFVSINSVKSYIRTAYRTMNVTTRSQAILWGLDHGLASTRARILPGGAQAPARLP